MQSLIEVFRMNEISPQVRARVIIKLGALINHQYAANVTEEIVVELVSILDPSNEILSDPHYKQKS